MIPPGAQASADVRVERVADYDGIEQKLRERIKNKLLPEARSSSSSSAASRRCEPTPPSRALAAHAQAIYARSE